MAWDLVGHDRAVDLLRRAIAHRRVSHAYLLVGPRHVGKHTLAVRFAQALNCERGEADPCGRCRRCRLIAADKHPEVRTIGVQPPHRVIRVAEIEAIQADSVLHPVDATRKVYILEQAELLHPDAAARLLKTLEEPPAGVVMLLTTVDPEAMLPTLVSRCQLIRLTPLPRPDLLDFLKRRADLAPDRVELLAALSGGCVGWLERALAEPDMLERRDRQLDELAELAEAGRAQRLRFARQLAERWQTSPDDVRSRLQTWIGWWRDVLRAQHGLDDAVLNRDRRDQIRRHARLTTPAASAEAVGTLRDVAQMLDENANARLALDVAVLALPVIGQPSATARPDR